MTALRLDVKAFAIPHPDKVHYGGEDAFCYDESLQLIAVADGVGGFEKQHEDDVADYSRSLVREVRNYFKAAKRKGRLDRNFNVGPQLAIEAAHRRVRKKGASTLCVARFNTLCRTLEVASLGDSRAAVYRNGRVFWSSNTQQHYFNCPFQLGYPITCNTARDAYVYRVPVMAGDVVVIGSDGLWDNVWDEEVMQHLPKDEMEVQLAAERIASAAFEHAVDEEYYSPFAAGSYGSSIDWPCGGKPDDITVVVARVSGGQAPLAEYETEARSSCEGRGSPSLSISSTSTFDPAEMCSLIDDGASVTGDDESSCSSSLVGDSSDVCPELEMHGASVRSSYNRGAHMSSGCYVWGPQHFWRGSSGRVQRAHSVDGWWTHDIRSRRALLLPTRYPQSWSVDSIGSKAHVFTYPATTADCSHFVSQCSAVNTGPVSVPSLQQDLLEISPVAVYLQNLSVEQADGHCKPEEPLAFGSVPSNILACLSEGITPEKKERTIFKTSARASSALPVHPRPAEVKLHRQEVYEPISFGCWKPEELQAVVLDIERVCNQQGTRMTTSV